MLPTRVEDGKNLHHALMHYWTSPKQKAKSRKQKGLADLVEGCGASSLCSLYEEKMLARIGAVESGWDEMKSDSLELGSSFPQKAGELNS